MSLHIFPFCYIFSWYFKRDTLTFGNVVQCVSWAVAAHLGKKNVSGFVLWLPKNVSLALMKEFYWGMLSELKGQLRNKYVNFFWDEGMKEMKWLKTAYCHELHWNGFSSFTTAHSNDLKSSKWTCSHSVKLGGGYTETHGSHTGKVRFLPGNESFLIHSKSLKVAVEPHPHSRNIILYSIRTFLFLFYDKSSYTSKRTSHTLCTFINRQTIRKRPLWRCFDVT